VGVGGDNWLDSLGGGVGVDVLDFRLGISSDGDVLLDDLSAGSVENEIDVDDVEDLSQSVGAGIIALRSLLNTLDLD